MNVAYVTPERCGSGHAVRGSALAEAADRTGIVLRAFGPVIPDPPAGYEGSDDWQARVVTFAPDLLIGDLAWVSLDALREALGVPAWLLVRWVPRDWLSDRGTWRLARWERRISIEPASDGLPGITHRIAPITVSAPRFEPVDGQELRAGYNTWWEAVRFGYHDRVRWVGDTPERAARMAVAVTRPIDGAEILVAAGSLERVDTCSTRQATLPIHSD